MATYSKIQYSTSKGQITLPIAWRRKVGTNAFVVHEKGGSISISPVSYRMPDDNNSDTVIFDAHRDNAGAGIPADVFIARLKKIPSARKKSHGRNR